MSYELEPLTGADEAFRWGVFVATIKPLVEEATGLDDARLRTVIADQLRAGTHQAIVKGGVRVGVLQVEETPNAISLSQIEILPDFQGLGIGSEMLRNVIERARRAGKPLTLHVFHENTRARALYERFGFVVTARGEHDVEMRWSPDSEARARE